jgi:hypothetical protein
VHAAAASHSQDKHRLMTKQLSSVSTTCPASTTSAFSVGSVTVQNGGGGGQRFRGSKEKIVYLRERKALKTIGIVVMGALFRKRLTKKNF